MCRMCEIDGYVPFDRIRFAILYHIFLILSRYNGGLFKKVS